MMKKSLVSIVLAAGAAFSCGDDSGRIRLLDGDASAHYAECGDAGTVDIASSLQHCGACDAPCDLYSACVDGRCIIPDSTPDAGMYVCPTETNFDLDELNCGGCGYVCPPVTECRGGECLYPEYVDARNVCFPDESMSPCEDGTICFTPSGSETNYCADPAKMNCEFDSECAGKDMMCLVRYCTPVTPEACDNIDNNRNGSIDEGLLGDFCYNGPARTENVGTCAPGLLLCQYGEWAVCIGERGPIAEEGILACDALDNDCDGCADNNYDERGVCIPPERRLFDIVMVLDRSSSMREEIAGTMEAMLRIGEPFNGNDDFHFGLVVDPYMVRDDPASAVVQPLDQFGRFVEGLERVVLTGDGIEPSYDAVYLVASEMMPGISFRPGARRIIIDFTDEPGASAMTPPLTAETMCAPFYARPGDVFGVITPTAYHSQYPCADIKKDITEDPARIAGVFLDILRYGCEDEETPTR